MPLQSTGVSFPGLQRIGTFPADISPFLLRFINPGGLSRTVKLGNALIVFEVAAEQFPVILSVPVYGGGIAPQLTVPPGDFDVALWVDWFNAGYEWVFDRPEPGD